MSFSRKAIIKFIAFPSFLLFNHSGYVFYQRQKSIQAVYQQKQNPLGADFRIGTTDDLVMDNLQTGDIILFKRKWYMNYFPVALVLLLYRSLYECEFDHLGVIVTDERGKTFVIENTLFGGVKCRFFEERIVYSQSATITLIPIVPRDLKISIKRLLAAQSALQTTPTEYSQLLTACQRKINQQYLGTTPLSSAQEDASCLCPNLSFLVRVYHLLDLRIDFSKDGNELNLQDLHRHNASEVKLSFSFNPNAQDRQRVSQIRFADENIQIRSR